MSTEIPDLMEAKRMLEISAVARRFGVSPPTVVYWIRSGQLRAINVGRTPNGRKPRYRVTEAAVAAFEAARAQAPTTSRRRRKKAEQGSVVRFY